MPKRTPTCHPDREHRARGYCSNCYARVFLKEYRKEYNKKYAEKNKEYFREYSRRTNRQRKGKRQSEATTTRLRNHHLTLNGYAKLLFEQNGVCKACRRVPDARGFCVDHDHKCCPGPTSCGKCVRGLLCGKCNSILGFANDQKYTLLQLADYIDQCPTLPENTPRYADFYGS